jgi:ribosomal protein S12 methylthiotransferase accessory factor
MSAMTAWASDLYTGLFTRFGPQRSRAYDPDLALYSGTAPLWDRPWESVMGSGAGWTPAEAEAACIGEAVERLQAGPQPDDQHLEASFRDWPLDEPAVPPSDWVLFHAEQYAQSGFPFRPFTQATVCRWLCCREATTGQPWWVPGETAWLQMRSGESHQLTAGVSTGLACGRPGQPLVLRGLQEVIERDAVVGAWWGRYPLEEYGIEEVLAGLGLPNVRARVVRPNLTYRCFRVESPYSAGVALVTLQGEDREGFCFSAGSACRETTAQAWTKALVEAIHGRHYVRHLKKEAADGGAVAQAPTSFAGHASYFSFHPERLRETVLARAGSRRGRPHRDGVEGLNELRDRLGSRRVLVRNMTPPALASAGLDWYVVRVLVPGLQPLHGSHHLAHLGGSLWAPRGLAEWVGQPPHPFP